MKKKSEKKRIQGKVKATSAKRAKKKPILAKSKIKTKSQKNAKIKSKAPKKVAARTKTNKRAHDSAPLNQEHNVATPIPQDVLVPENVPHGGGPHIPDNYESQRARNLEAKYAQGLKKPRGSSTHTFKSPGHGRGSSNKSDL